MFGIKVRIPLNVIREEFLVEEVILLLCGTYMFENDKRVCLCNLNMISTNVCLWGV